jgi:hypothetical protein
LLVAQVALNLLVAVEQVVIVRLLEHQVAGLVLKED